MHGTGAPQGRRGDFGEAEVSDLAGLHQFRHGAYRVFDGHFPVEAVQIIEIDAVRAEALKAFVATRGDLVGTSVDAALAVRVDLRAELRCEYDLVAPRAKHASDQFFVVPEPIGIGGVEEIHADVERAVQGMFRLGRIRLPVALGHAQAAKANLTHFEFTEQSLWQHFFSSRRENHLGYRAHSLSTGMPYPAGVPHQPLCVPPPVRQPGRRRRCSGVICSLFPINVIPPGEVPRRRSWQAAPAVTARPGSPACNQGPGG